MTYRVVMQTENCIEVAVPKSKDGMDDTNRIIDELSHILEPVKDAKTFSVASEGSDNDETEEILITYVIYSDCDDDLLCEEAEDDYDEEDDF